MKVLITGSAGFIGRHLVAECQRRGDAVTAFDSATDGLDALDFFRDKETYQFDLAFHCAAYIGGRAAIDGTPLTLATNLALDAHYFDWLERSGTRRGVYFSSSAAYPVSLQTLDNPHILTESDIDLAHLELADQTYGLVKLTGEQLADVARLEGCKISVVRPFSGYGSDQSLDYPFPSFIQRAKHRQDPFTIWGHGQQTRDFIHVDDIIAALFAMVENEIDGPVNLATGIPTTFIELATMMGDRVGYSPKLKFNRDAPKGVDYRVGASEELRKFYQPKIDLEEGIRRALDA